MELIIRQEGKADKRICHNGEKSCYELLMQYGISFFSACGGKGICGKCRVRFLEGAPEPVAAEQRFFSEKELQEGYRLSCRCGWNGDAIIEVEAFMEETMEALTVEVEKQEAGSSDVKWAIAVDIGTTTIAIALFEKKTGHILDTQSCMNRGRLFGTDVLARIEAANQGHAEQLRQMLQQDIVQGMKTLIRRAGTFSENIGEVFISGNTTMQHLLLGYDCKGLGQYPFTPVCLAPGRKSYREVFDDEMLAAEVVFFPGVSAFIGSDIVMGVYESGMYESDEMTLLLDLGTNGEMVLGNRERMLAASTAAGPALEAGNIEKGMPGVAGAISHVTIEDGRVKYETIGKRTPAGICGTGVLEMVAELLRTGKIDGAGTFVAETDRFTIVNGIAFSQQDIRQVQLAKAAIRAGIEILINDYGIAVSDVSKIYLAGGFGYQLKEETAIAIGMLPEEWRGKVLPIGNASLKGAIRYGYDADAKEKTIAIAAQIEEQNLAVHPQFETEYVRQINF